MAGQANFTDSSGSDGPPDRPVVVRGTFPAPLRTRHDRTQSDAASDEEELKLALTPEDADVLEAAAPFSGDPVIVQQESVYFDTPVHDLLHAGLSLRIRNDGRRRMQTIKADRSAAGMLIRSEWEREVTGDFPVVDRDEPVAQLLGARTALLSPVFVVRNERSVWLQNGIEIALDRARIVAGDRETRFCELELERKDGAVAELFATARKVDAIVPAQISPLSKAERGYRLLGPIPTATKAAGVELDSKMTAAQSFVAIAGACLHHFHANVPVVLDFGEAAALHQSRVAIRRLRTALSIYKPLLGRDSAAALNGELRWVASQLGAAREIDVLIERVGGEVLLDRLMDAKADAYAQAREVLRSQRYRKLLLDLAEWLASDDGLFRAGEAGMRELAVCDFADRVLARRRKVLKKRGRELVELDDEARHEARKAAKKLRYAADFFATLYTEKRARHRRKRFVRSLEALQDRLGALNDLVTAPELLERLGLADMPQVSTIVATERKPQMLEAAADAYHAFAGAKRYWH